MATPTKPPAGPDKSPKKRPPPLMGHYMDTTVITYSAAKKRFPRAQVIKATYDHNEENVNLFTVPFSEATNLSPTKFQAQTFDALEYLSEQNVNQEKKLKEKQSEIETNEIFVKMAQLQGFVDHLMGEVQTLATQNEALNGAVATLTTQNEALTGAVATLQEENAVLNGKVESLNGKVASLEEENATLKGKVASLEEENTTLKGKVASLEEENTTLEDKVAFLEEETTTLKGKVASLEEENNNETVASIEEKEDVDGEQND